MVWITLAIGSRRQDLLLYVVRLLWWPARGDPKRTNHHACADAATNREARGDAQSRTPGTHDQSSLSPQNVVLTSHGRRHFGIRLRESSAPSGSAHYPRLPGPVHSEGGVELCHRLSKIPGEAFFLKGPREESGARHSRRSFANSTIAWQSSFLE